MGKLLDEIGSSEASFIASQKVFFVATAPLDKNHHINISPKAPGSSLVVLGPHKVAYADLTGSGAETAAHVLENQRMTLMFCNLEEGPPKILRLYGTAELIIKENVETSLLERFPDSLTQNPGFRSIFVLTIDRISSSCGYSLPVMAYQKTRTTLNEHAERLGAQKIKEYSLCNNSFSIDGLPSLAHLRNPEVTIAPKRQDGYVRGEAIALNENQPQARPKVIAYQHVGKHAEVESIKIALVNLVLCCLSIFGAGALFGFLVLPYHNETSSFWT